MEQRHHSPKGATDVAHLGTILEIWARPDDESYPDGVCEHLDPAAPTDRLAEIIEQVRPDTIVTFGPDGVSWLPAMRRCSAT